MNKNAAITVDKVIAESGRERKPREMARARGKGTQIVARACGERDDWLPKTEQVDIRPRPPGVRNAPDKARGSINLSREKKNAAAKIAPPARRMQKERENADIQIIAAVP